MVSEALSLADHQESCLILRIPGKEGLGPHTDSRIGSVRRAAVYSPEWNVRLLTFLSATRPLGAMAFGAAVAGYYVI